MGQTQSTTTVSSSSLVALSSTSYPPCPPVELTTHSVTQTSTVTIYTTTYTYHETVPAAIITSTVSSVGTVRSPAPITTAHVTVTASPVVVLSQVPVSKTVTIPTVPGFTPLRCEATYLQPNPPTTTFYTTVTVSDGDAVYTTSTQSTSLTITTTVYTATLTVPAYYFVGITTEVTPTSTVTRTNPTSTVWAACNANNVVADHPLGHGYIGYAFPREPNVEVDSVSFNPTDCCERCQANSTCFGSAYFPHLEVPCKLFLLDPNGSQTCDPKYVGGRMDYLNDPLPTPYVYVSNGGCGQVQFYY